MNKVCQAAFRRKRNMPLEGAIQTTSRAGGWAGGRDWIDEENRVYVLYPIAEIQEDMGVSKKKAIACLSDLEKSGLVEKKVRGLGLPNLLYIKNFASALS